MPTSRSAARTRCTCCHWCGSNSSRSAASVSASTSGEKIRRLIDVGFAKVEYAGGHHGRHLDNQELVVVVDELRHKEASDLRRVGFPQPAVTVTLALVRLLPIESFDLRLRRRDPDRSVIAKSKPSADNQVVLGNVSVYTVTLPPASDPSWRRIPTPRMSARNSLQVTLSWH